MTGHHRYRGHRAHSFMPVDINELVELRARHRTFDGAYRRTALANLGYSLTVLRLFDVRFYRIGLLYLVLSGVLFIMAYLRARHSRHDFADQNEEAAFNERALPTVGQQDKQGYGRPFMTAGLNVLALAVVVAAVEIVLLSLIFQI